MVVSFFPNLTQLILDPPSNDLDVGRLQANRIDAYDSGVGFAWHQVDRRIFGFELSQEGNHVHDGIDDFQAQARPTPRFFATTYACRGDALQSCGWAVDNRIESWQLL